jgi:arylsulfatase A-like enzyme
VVVITSDHGESLGEHGYYFDHGEDLFDPCLRIPLVVRVPGAPAGLRVRSLATTLDIAPTILDAVKVSYPPDLSGRSLLPAALGRSVSGESRLFAQNDRGLTGTFDARFKLVATPSAGGARFAYYDRREDPTENR